MKRRLRAIPLPGSIQIVEKSKIANQKFESNKNNSHFGCSNIFLAESVSEVCSLLENKDKQIFTRSSIIKLLYTRM